MDRETELATALFNQLDYTDKLTILGYMEELTHRQPGRPVINIADFLNDRGEEGNQ